MRVDTSTVGRDVGRIVQAVSLMSVASIAVAAANGEFYAAPAFGITAVVMGAVGTGLASRYRRADPPEKREAMVTAATAWGVVGLLGSLPLLLVA